MRAAFLIAGKDLKQRLRDKSAFLFGIVAPLVLATIFSFVFNPIGDTTSFHAEYVLVNEDGGAIGDAFVQALESMEAEDIITLREVDSVAVAREEVERGSDAFADTEEARADAAFVVPAGFSEAVLQGRGGTMSVIGAKGSELAAQVAYSVASGFAAELGAAQVSVMTVLPQGVEPDPMQVGQLAQEAAVIENPISLEDVSAETKQLDGTTYMTAGMAVFFLFFAVSFGVSGLLEEGQLGTMSRLMAAPINRQAILLGKGITAFLIGIISMGVLVAASSVLLGAEWGNPVGVAILVLAAVFASMGILAIVASFAKTQEAASNLQAIVSLVFGFLGGTFFPVAQVSGILSKLSLVTPHQWFLRGLGDLAGGNLADIWPSVGALIAFGVVSVAISMVFLRKAVYR